ncbi:MAG: spore coat associated protein CotJA [Clostridiales bacterium]|nr:spore coat associated protein CotJA [Clostridiales bacterium]
MIHWENLPLAMGYVPIQRFKDTFDLCKGYHMGTIFPELCKPFCGKGGGRRC